MNNVVGTIKNPTLLRVEQSTKLQEIKNYLFGSKNKDLNCYTALGFKDERDFVKKSDPDHITKNPFLIVRRKQSKQIIEKKLKKINQKYPSGEHYINKSIEEKGLSFLVNLKNEYQSCIDQLKKDEESTLSSNLYGLQRTLDYIEQTVEQTVEKSLGFSLEQSLDKTVDKFILIKHKEKLNDKLKKEYEEKIKKFNRKHPFSLKFINDDVQQNGLPFITESKQQAISYIKNKEKDAAKGNDHYKDGVQINIQKIKEDKSSLLYQYQLMLDYINLMEKNIGFSIESYNLLSEIREGSVKVLSNLNLRSAYDEGIKRGDLKSFSEEWLKYQQQVSKKNSGDIKEPAIKEEVEKINNQAQVEEISQKADISFDTVSTVKGQKKLFFSNEITLLLSIYAKSIGDIFGIKGLTSIIIELSRSGINVETETNNNIRALEDSPKESKTLSDAQDNKKEVTTEVVDNTSSWWLFESIGNMMTNTKNWGSIITGRIVNFVKTNLIDDVDNSSEAERGTPGNYRVLDDILGCVSANTNTNQQKTQISSKLDNIILQQCCQSAGMYGSKN